MPNTAQFSPLESLSIEAACAALSTVLLMLDEASNIGHPPLTGNVISQAFMRIEQDYGHRTDVRQEVGAWWIKWHYWNASRKATTQAEQARIREQDRATALAKLTPYERELLRIE